MRTFTLMLVSILLAVPSPGVQAQDPAVSAQLKQMKSRLDKLEAENDRVKAENFALHREVAALRENLGQYAQNARRSAVLEADALTLRRIVLASRDAQRQSSSTAEGSETGAIRIEASGATGHFHLLGGKQVIKDGGYIRIATTGRAFVKDQYISVGVQPAQEPEKAAPSRDSADSHEDTRLASSIGADGDTWPRERALWGKVRAATLTSAERDELESYIRRRIILR